MTLLRKMPLSPLGKEKQTHLEHLVPFDIFGCDAEDRAGSIVVRVDVNPLTFENSPLFV